MSDTQHAESGKKGFPTFWTAIIALVLIGSLCWWLFWPNAGRHAPKRLANGFKPNPAASTNAPASTVPTNAPQVAASQPATNSPVTAAKPPQVTTNVFDLDAMYTLVHALDRISKLEEGRTNLEKQVSVLQTGLKGLQTSVTEGQARLESNQLSQFSILLEKLGNPPTVTVLNSNTMNATFTPPAVTTSTNSGAATAKADPKAKAPSASDPPSNDNKPANVNVNQNIITIGTLPTAGTNANSQVPVSPQVSVGADPGAGTVIAVPGQGSVAVPTVLCPPGQQGQQIASARPLRSNRPHYRLGDPMIP